MASADTLSRRNLLKKCLLGATVGRLALMAPLATLWLTGVHAAVAAAQLSPDDPAAKKLKYTEDVSKAKGVPAGNQCANCALYQGSAGSAQGPCQIFPGKQVKAAGWCSSWAPQM